MKIGVVFPQIEMPADPGAIKTYAQTAEGLGFDYLLAYDHVLGANPERPDKLVGPYTCEDSFHEPFVLFGYLAALTERLELVTGIIILPQRQTALVAKQTAQVDVLSNGRLRLGFGVGWNHVEYEALNQNFKTRGKRYDEQIPLLRELWTNPLVTFKGEYHTISDAGLNPMPVQQPIPIWFGGRADAALRRAARLGDGWMPAFMPAEQATSYVDKLQGFLAEAGKSLDDFGIDPWITIASYDSPDDWAKQAEAWKALGATHIAINTMNAGFSSVDEHLAAIQQFKEIV
ncbi:MAG: LLM class F420-dependent oxidoreductase [Chloroflexota bacterium]